ncbi:MAG: tRNA1(Val) (adenine(37)-N6)-methyltransferase [Flavobacteriaceae bacterium]
MKSTLFHFQQFSVRQCASAMKIGTDGVLLGAWSEIQPKAKTVLDIGTGTGLIALMLAQRFPEVTIDALEIDQGAANEAAFNFNKSPWSDRLMIIHCALEDFTVQRANKYDHIICNPPFYKGSYPIKNPARDLARNNRSLTYDKLFNTVKNLLSESGTFSLITPVDAVDAVCLNAEQAQLHLTRQTLVRGHRDSKFKRALMTFSRQEQERVSKTLTLEVTRHQRTTAHQKLVADFYL